MKNIKEYISYNQETGVFTWIKDSGSNKVAGKVAGTTHRVRRNTNYISIRYKGKAYLAHRLAWFFVYGVFPKNQIDHKDGCGSHNWIKNLSDVTNRKNQQNKYRHRGGALVGAQKNGKNWIARIKPSTKINGIREPAIYLGTFKTELEAHKAYIKKLEDLSTGG